MRTNNIPARANISGQTKLRWLGYEERKTGKCSNENTEDVSQWTPKVREIETE